ncbi:ABC transporter ATP-binding protein [Seleniivibrio woodruffii]|uniref:ABC transporter ATP-binding protein n=1 Tax=Seleniivibrio woodruffii TaxID=1078050 RepID=UPI0026F0E2D7|nr:ATP-binding cassette domain-containing protein [Seleniivibrio woodruffii]
MDNELLKLNNLTKQYRAFEGIFKGSSTIIKAVDNISLSITKGRSLGIVGESGSGKTTLAKILTGIIMQDSGEVLYKGRDIHALGKDYQEYRRNVQMVFQDPYLSLNPKLTVFSSMKDAVIKYSGKKNVRQECENYLAMVGLDKEYLDRYPHEFSGGQRQRLSIARALSLNPEIIVADEPVSSLDVSVQSQILNLMKKLKLENSLTFILISHDLAVVSFLCDDILVMNRGEAVEYGTAQEVLENPQQEYTKRLIAASKGE